MPLNEIFFLITNDMLKYIEISVYWLTTESSTCWFVTILDESVENIQIYLRRQWKIYGILQNLNKILWYKIYKWYALEKKTYVDFRQRNFYNFRYEWILKFVIPSRIVFQFLIELSPFIVMSLSPCHHLNYKSQKFHN